MHQDVEGGGVWGYTELKGIVKDLFGEVNGVGGMRVAADKGGEEGVAGEEVGFNMEELHLVEELEGEVGVVGEGVGREGGVEEWLRETRAAEGELVEGVAGVVGGDEVEEEGVGGGVAAVDEEAGEEGKEGLRGGGERRVGRVGEDVEEGEEGGGVGAVELGGGEDGKHRGEGENLD
nr:glycine-rich protein DOT1-like [Arachis hypogaea]